MSFYTRTKVGKKEVKKPTRFAGDSMEFKKKRDLGLRDSVSLLLESVLDRLDLRLHRLQGRVDRRQIGHAGGGIHCPRE